MPSNVTLNSGSGGANLATKLRTHDGDSTQVQVVTLAGVSGTEDSYTFGDINGDATNGLDVDVTRVGGTVTVDNAGTFAVQVDGDALTALQTIDNYVFADDAAFTLASSSVAVAGAIRDDSLATLTAIEGDAVPLRVSSTGALHVTGGGGGTEYTEDVATPATIVGTATMMERDDALATLTPIEGDWAGMRCSAEGALWVQEFNSDAILADTANIDTNLGTLAGAVAGSEIQVDIVADGAGLLTTAAHDAAFGTAGTADTQVRTVQGIASMTPLLVDATGQGDVPITLAGETVALGAGSASIGTLGANSGVDIGDVDVTSISAGSNLIGDVGISGARTSGGTTIFRSIDLDETEEQIKATAGQVYWITAFNLAAGVRYLKFYNATAATVVVGTTTPVLTFPIPTQGDTNGAGFVLAIPNGIAFGTAITVAATTGVADADTGAPGANEVIVNIGYA